MEAFKEHVGLAAPLNRLNVDTDQIIPKQFLKRIERTGFGQFLFYDWRFLDNGDPNPDFVLNDPRYQEASILVAGANFGCGSSREHAPWALQQYGFKAVIAPSFADIFRNNCYKNGILPIALPDNVTADLMEQVEGQEGYRLMIDLETQQVVQPDGTVHSFEIGDFEKYCLLNGLDEIGWTLQFDEQISAYEGRIGT
ncbi:3-isopropylmalate dehydratase small subunit [Candidatus Poribacteria bacterium]|nr:3-isopropylmalate dehydratase small subunit [Candidatus Poribacteria bacterium]